MFLRPLPLTIFFALLCLLVNVSSVVGSTHRPPHIRHHRFTKRLSTKGLVEKELPKRLRRRKSCEAHHRPANSTSALPVVGNSTNPVSSQTSPMPKPSSSKSAAGGIGLGNILAPANWPTKTQAGAAPAATVTSPADPFLEALSDAFNNGDNSLFTQVHKGQMTYYNQGLGACGDTYDDSSFTAAVSKLMYDAWPGAAAGEMNRNPICGPFVLGRKIIGATGALVTAVPGSSFVIVGGDGLLNCDASVQCHIPLTATVKHGDKAIQVKIVDRCEACAVGDIDLTPAAFAALADQSLGRTDVEWSFNNY